MQEYNDLYQDIAAQISKLPLEHIKAVQQYIQELDQTDLQHEEQQNQYLTFSCCGQILGINIRQVVQILQMPQITPLPDSLPYMKGVISLRDEMVPVIDLRIRLTRKEVDYTDRNCLVIMSVQDRSFGAVVDCVCSVETILPEEICLPPQQDERKTPYLRGIVKHDTVILLIDPDYLFANGDLEHILDASVENLPPA